MIPGNIQLTAACLLIATAAHLNAKGTSVAEFDDRDGDRLGWTVVDDGVMGGLSKGKISIGDKGILKFSGKLSLENNGGFSSLRSRTVKLDLSDSEGLVARVRGDGRTYQIRLGSDSRFRGMDVSFMAAFPTTKGEWTEVKIPFSDLAGSFRGMTLKKEVFNPSDVRRIGLLLGDKKTGPFELEVDWIRTYGSDDASIVDLAVADGRFKTLATALTEAGLVEILNGKGPFTVFAPTDEAFAKLPENTVRDLLKPENRDKLTAILKLHVSAGSVNLSAALAAGEATSLQGEALPIAFEDGRVRIGGATLVNADISASNGVIHVIDSVLLPSTPPAPENLLNVAKDAGKFSTLLAAIEAAGLTPLLEGEKQLTIFAPTDEAFANLPEGTVETLLKPENGDALRAILAYHAISGKVSAGDALNVGSTATLNGAEIRFAIKDGTLKANESTIRSTDIQCENGVIHVIDAVLLPPAGKGQAAKPTSMDPLERIEAAIDKGVPAYNGGDPEKCAKIYEDCLKALAADASLEETLRTRAGDTIKRTAEHEDASRRAWIYRSALDKLYENIGSAQG
jgi:transforming growth factor-beta-induced protein